MGEDPRPWPARHGRPVGRFRHLEVIHASDVLDDAVACVVPNIDAKGEVGLGFHGQVRLDLSWPRCYFFAAALVFHVMSRAQLRELMVLFVVSSALTLAVFFLALFLLPFETFAPFPFPRFPGSF